MTASKLLIILLWIGIIVGSFFILYAEQTRECRTLDECGYNNDPYEINYDVKPPTIPTGSLG